MADDSRKYEKVWFFMKLRDKLFDPAVRSGYISDAMASQVVPGLSMAAIRAGAAAGTWCYGVANAQGSPVTADTVFEAASLTKTLFACLAMRMAQSGTLDLDAPMAPQIPTLKLSDDGRIETLTPRMALCHATGLPNWADKPLQFLFNPNQGFGYSGEGFYFLQRLIEKQTGKALPQLFSEQFFDPWGMNHSSGIWHEGLNMSNGFDTSGQVNSVRDCVDGTGNAPEPNAAWSLYTTSGDYARYIEKLLAGDALEPGTLDMMTTPHNSPGGNVAWGLGWGLVKSSPGVMWHWGDNTGFKSLIVVDRTTGDGLAIFTNSDNGTAFTLALAKEFTDGDFFGDLASFIAVAE